MDQENSPMTERQRVEALLNRRKPDRVPLWPYFIQGFSMVYTKTSIASAYNEPEAALSAQRKTCQDFGWVFVPLLSYASYGGWEFGGEIKWPSGEFAQAPTVASHSVKTVKDALNLRMPEVADSGIVPLTMEFCKLSAKETLPNEPFNVVPQCGGMAFTVAANITGPDILSKWLLKKPEAAHHLLKVSSDFLLEVARYWKETFGLDGALPTSGEPTTSNALISPKHFKQFVLPYDKEINEKTLALGYKTLHIHICGDQNANLPFWSQIPMGNPGIVSIGPEIELEAAAEAFPQDIIMGNLDTTIIQTGTPGEVYEASRKVIERGKKLPGGFIFAPGCELPPMAPVENVMAMTNAVNEFGWYE